ncbi:MAG: hypothetical protein EAX86_01925 [Candidatus Heimdallarchaeota archaeon]|nr:hypothetical protein [Candidatus Heimdallarchaeota archaeon]
MKRIHLGEEIYEWIDTPDILSTVYFKVKGKESIKLIEVRVDKDLTGVILLGRVEVIVDALIYSNTHGDVGTTVEFTGKNLVIFGLTVENITKSIMNYYPTEEETHFLYDEANAMIAKLESTLKDKKASIDFDEDDSNAKYIIFGKRRFLLVGSENNIVLIYDKQIAVRKGESKLILIDPVEGIVIAENEKLLKIGGGKSGYSILGELGVNIASSVLDGILWD